MNQKVKITKIIGGALMVEDHYIFLLRKGQHGILREVEPEIRTKENCFEVTHVETFVEKNLVFFNFNAFQKQTVIDIISDMAKLGKYVKVKYIGKVLCKYDKARDIEVVFNKTSISLTKKYFNENDYVLDISFESFGRENNFGRIDISPLYPCHWGDGFNLKEGLPFICL